MNSILLAILLTSATPAFEAEALDGRTIVGPLAELTTDRLAIAAAEGRVSLLTKDLLTVSPQQKPKPPSTVSGIVVELADGSTIRGRQYVAHTGKAKITLAGGEVVEVATNMVRTVLFGSSESDPRRAEWVRLTSMKGDTDLLIVRGGDAIDYHKGVLHDVTEDAVRFDLDGEILPIKRSKVYGFAYRHGAAAELPPAICRITDSTGSEWSVQTLTLAENLQWTTPAGIAVTQPLESIARIDFSGGKLVYLSDLKPDSVAWAPYFGVSADLPSMKQFYAPRVDRGFDSSSLELSGVPYRKGLAMHSRTEMVYRLPERFRRFQAIAGIADDVRPSGKVRLVVRGDDKTLFEAKVAGSDAPRPIDLDVTGVRRLTILVDFSDGVNVGDHLLLCNARVSK